VPSWPITWPRQGCKARCHQKLRQPEKAIDQFREYLAKEKKISADERKEIDGYIKEMEALRDEQARQAAPPPPNNPPPPVVTPVNNPPPPPPNYYPPPPPPTSSPPPVPARAGLNPTVLMAVGAVLIVVLVIVIVAMAA